MLPAPGSRQAAALRCHQHCAVLAHLSMDMVLLRLVAASCKGAGHSATSYSAKIRARGGLEHLQIAHRWAGPVHA